MIRLAIAGKEAKLNMQVTKLLILLRPRQWPKNAFVVAPIFFTPRVTEVEAWAQIALATLAFLAASFVVYLFNDLLDVEEDRKHPVKRLRPLATGEVVRPAAISAMVCFLGAGLIIAKTLPPGCLGVLALYIILNLFYTLWLKHIALLDVMSVASCYVLRVLMGCFAIAVFISPWIILATFLLALALSFGKRFHEYGIESYREGKKNLQGYSRDLLDRMLTICCAAALMVYAIYAVEMAERFHNMAFVYTVAFVAFGLFRYLQQIHVYERGGEPEYMVLHDRLQQVNIVGWLGMVTYILSSA